MLPAVVVELEQPDWRPPLVVAIEFDRRNLRLARYIAQLRMSDHRRAQTARHACPLDRPAQYPASLAVGQQRAQYEPTVLRLIAPVVERDSRAIGPYCHTACRIVGREHEPTPFGDRQRLGAGAVAASARRLALGRP